MFVFWEKCWINEVIKQILKSSSTPLSPLYNLRPVYQHIFWALPARYLQHMTTSLHLHCLWPQLPSLRPNGFPAGPQRNQASEPLHSLFPITPFLRLFRWFILSLLLSLAQVSLPRGACLSFAFRLALCSTYPSLFFPRAPTTTWHIMHVSVHLLSASLTEM